MLCRIEVCPKHIRDFRVDVQGSRVALDTYFGQGNRKSRDLNEVTKQFYEVVVVERNLQLELCYVSCKENQADGQSRRISAVDAMLSIVSRQKLGSESIGTFD